ncbi:MAG: SDR family oxidoreductase [Pseudomonadota bacterium]
MGERQPVALVTGAAKRIGRAIALSLADRGYAIGIHYNGSVEAADAVVAQIRDGGGAAAAFRANLTDRGSIRTLLPACADVLGPVTCLVNNASVFREDAIGALDDALWDAHMAVHVEAPALLTEALAHQLPDASTGVVINMIDQRVWRLNPQFFSYTISKAALWTATQTMAQALAPRVRVCAIGPGPTLQSVHQASETFVAEAANVPLQRGPSLEEVTAAIGFILATPSMTGQMIALDGGQHLAWETPDVAHASASGSGQTGA